MFFQPCVYSKCWMASELQPVGHVRSAKPFRCLEEMDLQTQRRGKWAASGTCRRRGVAKGETRDGSTRFRSGMGGGCGVGRVRRVVQEIGKVRKGCRVGGGWRVRHVCTYPALACSYKLSCMTILTQSQPAANSAIVSFEPPPSHTPTPTPPSTSHPPTTLDG